MTAATRPPLAQPTFYASRPRRFSPSALLTGVLGSGQMAMMCSAAQEAFPLSGMVPMYVLMSVFHSAPWLKLIASRRSGARRS
jgi:hypothetical protein